jgi:hypothetical protein
MLLLGLAPLALGGSGCKQGEGDRCEIKEDCASGLVCESSAAGSGDTICRRSGTGGTPRPDAALPPVGPGPTTPSDAGPAADGPALPGGGDAAAAPDARPASDGAAPAEGAADGPAGG